MSEARTDDRLDRLEEDVREIKAMLTGLVPLINRIDAQLPHLATNAELADLRGETRTGFADLRGELRSGLAGKPSHAYLWGVMAAMVGSQAVILAAAALALMIFQMLPAHGAEPPHRPYSGAANCKAATTGAIRYNSTNPGHRILQRHGMEGACSGAKQPGHHGTRRKGYFVMSYSTYNGGAFGNLTGADAACLTDITTHTGWMGYSTANSNGQLVGSKVRAFLCSGVVCNNLIPLTPYYFADAANSGAGGGYFTTDSNGFGPNNSKPWSAANYFSGSYSYWTNRSYTSASLWNSTPVDGNSCFNWSAAYGDTNAEVGVSGATNAGRWSSFLDTCDKSYRVICVVNP